MMVYCVPLPAGCRGHARLGPPHVLHFACTSVEVSMLLAPQHLWPQEVHRVSQGSLGLEFRITIISVLRCIYESADASPCYPGAGRHAPFWRAPRSHPCRRRRRGDSSMGCARWLSITLAETSAKPRSHPGLFGGSQPAIPKLSRDRVATSSPLGRFGSDGTTSSSTPSSRIPGNKTILFISVAFWRQTRTPLRGSGAGFYPGSAPLPICVAAAAALSARASGRLAMGIFCEA